MEKPKRLTKILFDNLKVIKNKIKQDGDFTLEDINKLEKEIVLLVNTTLNNAKDLGLELKTI